MSRYVIGALLALMSTTAIGQVHGVSQVNLLYIDSVSGTNVTTIQAGTTVQWTWSSGTHTVTSGTGSADPTSGFLFDGTLTVLNSTFSYTFNTPGTYPYYCIPHEASGHNGTVVVTGRALSITSPGPGGISMGISNYTPGNIYLMLIAFTTSTPTGSGPLFGVDGSAWSQLFAPVITGVADATGGGGLFLPAGLPVGLSFDVVSLELSPILFYQGATNVVNFTIL